MRREARGRDVLAQPLRDGEEDAVVELPPVELLEAEELSDLKVDDAEPLDPLDRGDAVRILEGVERQSRDAVVDEPLLAQAVDASCRSGRPRRAATGCNQSDRARAALRCSFLLRFLVGLRARGPRATLRRSSSAPNGLAR